MLKQLGKDEDNWGLLFLEVKNKWEEHMLRHDKEESKAPQRKWILYIYFLLSDWNTRLLKIKLSWNHCQKPAFIISFKWLECNLLSWIFCAVGQISFLKCKNGKTLWLQYCVDVYQRHCTEKQANKTSWLRPLTSSLLIICEHEYKHMLLYCVFQHPFRENKVNHMNITK